MAGYLGAIPVPQATQHRESFTATSGQTTFNTAGYTVGFLDVYLNGSHLSPADFTATNGSDVVLASGASADDVCDIISYTAFEVADQTFTGTTTLTGDLLLGDNDKAIFGAGSDLQIYHDGSNSYITDAGTGNTVIETNGSQISLVGGGEYMVRAQKDGATRLYYDGSQKIATTSTGIDVTGAITADGLTVQNVNDSTTNTAEFRNDNGNRTFRFAQNTSGDADLLLEKNDGTDAVLISTHGDSYFNGGNFIVGETTTSAVGNGTGAYIASNGQLYASSTSSHFFNRKDSDGDIATFRKDGSTVGSIGNSGTVAYIMLYPSTGLRGGASSIVPATTNGAASDNTKDWGTASYRWDDIFATNGTIQTSDANEKQDIASLTSAEMLVAKRISALFKTFRWKDKVAAKGNDARTHTGIIAQDVQSAFTAEGLDAGDYSLFISSTWWEHDVDVPAVEAVAEVTDEDGNVTTEAVEAVDAYTRTDMYDTEDEAPEGATERTRLGIRYPELLSFVAAYNEQRFASIETRLTALEG